MRSHLIKIFESNVIEHFPQDLKYGVPQKIFPLAVIRAKEAEAVRIRTKRQYENKQQKSNQQRDYDSQQTKKELNNFLLSISKRYVQSVMNDIEQFNEQFQNESFIENIACEINNKEKNNMKIHNINKDVENKYADEHSQYKNNFDIKHGIKKKCQREMTLSLEQKSIIAQGKWLNDLHMDHFNDLLKTY